MDNSIIVYIVDEYVRNYLITSQEGRICWLKNNTVMTKHICLQCAGLLRLFLRLHAIKKGGLVCNTN
jgi:hypothetical protein